MSFKLKEKTIYLSMIGVIAFVVVFTFCIIAVKNPHDYADTLKMVLMLILGSLFKTDTNNTPPTT
jgi:hypothetical protein